MNKPFKKNRGNSVKTLIAVAVVTLVVLIGVSIFAYFKQKESQTTTKWITHTQNIIAKLQALESQIFEAGSAQRGFIITGQVKYRDLVDEKFNKVTGHLGEIQRLTRDNDIQQNRIENIREPFAQLRLFISNTITHKSENEPEKAVALIESGRGQRLIEELQQRIHDMMEHETQLLQQRLAADQAARDFSSSVIVASSSVAIILISLTLLFMYREFTNRKKAQEELQKSSAFMETMLKFTPFALVASREDGHINLFNDAAERLLGYKANEVIGKSPAIWHDPEEVAKKSEELSRRFDEIVPVGFETFVYRARKKIIESDQYTYIRKDGTRVPVKLTVTALRDDEDNITGFIGIAYDLTQQLEYENAIIRAKEQALAGTQAKSEFLANMSHEIRTPMNAIMGMAELLNESKLDDEQKKYVEIFQRAGESLLNIINDILDLSKIEAGHFELDRVPFRFSEVIQKSVEIMALKAHQKGLEFAVEIDEDMHDHYIGDPNRIRQVILNLLGNSVKFTKKGEIILRIKPRPASVGKQEILIEVQDTGIGMSDYQVKRLFQRFAQADSSITKEFGGTGLGLNITKRLAHLMNGDINATSTQGLGSRFTVNIIIDLDESSESENTAIDLKDKSFLIVDDNRTNRMIVRKILEHAGAEVTEAEEGEEALEQIVMKKQIGQPFEMVLLDSRMPGMDGFALAEKVQNDEKLKGPLLMMLTSDNRPGDLQRSRQLGLRSYLIKPILKKELMESISKALTVVASEVPSITPETKNEGAISNQRLSILLADDNDENRLVVRSYLKNQPFRVDEARNGQEALDLFKEKDYDLILMDMQMPVMDGYTATRSIRKLESESGEDHVPILALTAYALKEEMDKSFEAGCNGHLTKPVSKGSVLKAIETYTSDLLVDIDADLKDLIPEYLIKRRQEVKELRVALAREDYKLIQSLGHKLRGAAGSYGFDTLSEIGKELEESGKVKNATNVEKALIQYQHYMKRVKISYKQV